MDIEAVVVRRAVDDPAERVRLAKWIQRAWFPDKVWGSIYRVVCVYGKDNPLTLTALQDLFARTRKLGDDTRQKIADRLGRLVVLGSVADGDYEHALRRLLVEAERNFLWRRMTFASGKLEDGEMEDARGIVRALAGGLDQFGPPTEQARSARTMATLETEPRIGEFRTGFDRVDEETGGASRGELVIWGGYTSEYKTLIAGHITVVNFWEGRNILYASLEMKERQMRRRFLAVHANKIERRALRYRAIQTQEFASEHEREVYNAAVEDFDSNPDYGEIHIWEPPLGTTIVDVMSYAETLQQGGLPLDIVVIDHAGYLAPVDHRKSKWEQVGETVQRAKRSTLNFDRGRGLWMLLLWQISRKGKKDGHERGYYELSDLAESSDAERSADIVLWSMVKQKWRDENECKIGLAKNREGNLTRLYRGERTLADPAFGLIEDLSSGRARAAATDDQIEEEDFKP